MTGMARITNKLKHWLMQEHKEKWMTKPLHRQLLRQTQQIADSKSWAWLTIGGLKKDPLGHEYPDGPCD